MAKVLVPMADGCEDLEAVTIIDVLRRADIEVVTAGLEDRTVTGSRKTIFVTDTLLDNIINENFDLIALPGGLPGADHLNADPRIHSLIKNMHNTGKAVSAICAAPKVLASAGILNQRKATSFPGVLDSMNLGSTEITGSAVEIDGNIITAKSAGTAMDFALSLVGYLLGKDKQLEIEKQLHRN